MKITLKTGFYLMLFLKNLYQKVSLLKKQVQGHDSESVLLQPSPKHDIFVISNFYVQNSHLKGYFVQIYWKQNDANQWFQTYNYKVMSVSAW